mmetsp:Transcript_19520/g.52049  ORF Transcript_19520/g.52049 Transcript_19520/m.52049 type:complete len:132 (-) Transcript_19520:53-448(-)
MRCHWFLRLVSHSKFQVEVSRLEPASFQTSKTILEGRDTACINCLDQLPGRSSLVLWKLVLRVMVLLATGAAVLPSRGYLSGRWLLTFCDGDAGNIFFSFVASSRAPRAKPERSVVATEDAGLWRLQNQFS